VTDSQQPTSLAVSQQPLASQPVWQLTDTHRTVSTLTRASQPTAAHPTSLSDCSQCIAQCCRAEGTLVTPLPLIDL
jgi:hypothetical protein